ncbi:MAG: LytTR family transcriptional regulator DNA-binding domain-containing protein, partial [Muribaculaceae bacterium]|nr:LytTR family transcriptional regulator DNA-binding domain-containing protein [Muribaculaceae bacterium]
FMRVHRSFIVNMHKVEIVERGRVVFGKTYIPISDSRRDDFLARLGK